MSLRRALATLIALGLFGLHPKSDVAAADDRIWRDRMNAAISAHQRDDLEGAERYLKSALPEAQRLGAQDQRLAETHAALGTIYFDQGRAEEAKANLEQAQAIFDVVLGPHETRLASNLNALGLVYGQLAEDDAAVAAFEQAAVIYEHALGPDHTTLSRVLENHAGLLLQMARYDEAKLIFPRILSIREKELGVHHPNLVPLLDSYALSLRMSGDKAGAEAVDVRTAEILARRKN